MIDGDILLHIIVPNLIGFVIYFATNEKYKTARKKDVWFQPPPAAFFIVWPILFGYTGYMLYKAKLEKNTMLEKIIYILLGLSYLWMALFGIKQDKGALLVLMLMLMASISFDTVVYDSFGITFPLWETWLIFAFVLSVQSGPN